MTDELWIALATLAFLLCWKLKLMNDANDRKRAEAMTDAELERELDLSHGLSGHEVFTEEYKRRQLAKRVKEAA